MYVCALFMCLMLLKSRRGFQIPWELQMISKLPCECRDLHWGVLWKSN